MGFPDEGIRDTEVARLCDMLSAASTLVFGLVIVTGNLLPLAYLIFFGCLWTLSQWRTSQIQMLRPQGQVIFRLVNHIRYAVLLQAEKWHRFVGERRMTCPYHIAFCNLLQFQLSSNCLASWPLFNLAIGTDNLQPPAYLTFLGYLWTSSQWRASQIQTLRPQGQVTFRLENRMKHAVLLQTETWHRFVGGRRMSCSCHTAFCNLLQLQLWSNSLVT